MTMSDACVICGNPLGKGKQKYCSFECRREGQRRNYQLLNPFLGINRSTTGAISELRVAVDLMSKGYHVFRAMSPACPCDLIIFKESSPSRVQVRTSYMTPSGKVYAHRDKRDHTKKIDVYAFVLSDRIVYEPSLV